MIEFIKNDISTIGDNFIPEKYIPEGFDEYYLRDIYYTEKKEYRLTTLEERDILIRNKNRIYDWDKFFVTKQFNPHLIMNNTFYGLIRISNFESIFLEYHNLRLPVGIYNSTIISCDLGENVSINNVFYLSHYIISDYVIISNIQEMLVSDKAKFGNCIIKDGEKEDSIIEIELGNENGKRAILAFDGILSADCYLWEKERDDEALLSAFKKWTYDLYDSKRGYYGFVGKNCVIKNSRSIKDVIVKEHTYIKGANKLKNITINSSQSSPTQIGEGVELVNGIVGYGCRVFYGVKAVRFILADNSQLKYGARLINSFLGENSTISCCEVLNSIIFPFHEQHHNNSFLISATVLGQSNVAAGATIGSNHNSRVADGEIVAGRGFWPGLCTSFKHFSNFASFCIISKGDYDYELNVRFPFSLISNDLLKNQLQIMPAYYLMYNMYALSRNSYKFKNRDKRVQKNLNLEFDFIAPDTINEVFDAIYLLKKFTGLSFFESQNVSENDENVIIKKGEELLEEGEEIKFDVFAKDVENSTRNIVILKAEKAYIEYKNLINYYCIKYLFSYCDKMSLSLVDCLKQFGNEKRMEFINLGGQLFEKQEIENIKQKIKTHTIKSWDELHNEYKESAKQYDFRKCAHAIASVLEINNIEKDKLSIEKIKDFAISAKLYSDSIYFRTYDSRLKDYTNKFRNTTFKNNKERDCVIGKLKDDSSIQICKKMQDDFKSMIDKYIGNL